MTRASRNGPSRDNPRDDVGSPPRDDPPPTPPVAPSPEACCGNGCDPCVYDLYEAALRRYEAARAEWAARHGRRAKPRGRR
jgi:hypothetical protein